MEPTLLILAAGMGSRYGGLKQIAPMGPHGETVLDYSIYDALRAGFTRVVFVIRREFEENFRRAVGRRFESRVHVSYVFQELEAIPGGFEVLPRREKPWGTGHAIWCARDAVTAPFLSINADDFYGFDAYRQLAGFLSGSRRMGAPAEFAMAGFRLENTLSEFGAVARGVCEVDGRSRLEHIEELTGIERAPRSIINREKDKPERSLTGRETVSMNFWGFTPVVFGMLERMLEAFLRAQGSEAKSEFYIPAAVGKMIASGDAEVVVLPTSSEWFGITYQEDQPRVVASIGKLIAEGVYPAPLWS